MNKTWRLQILYMCTRQITFHHALALSHKPVLCEQNVAGAPGPGAERLPQVNTRNSGFDQTASLPTASGLVAVRSEARQSGQLARARSHGSTHSG